MTTLKKSQHSRSGYVGVAVKRSRTLPSQERLTVLFNKAFPLQLCEALFRHPVFDCLQPVNNIYHAQAVNEFNFWSNGRDDVRREL